MGTYSGRLECLLRLKLCAGLWKWSTPPQGSCWVVAGAAHTVHSGMGTRGWKLRQPEGGGSFNWGKTGGKGIREEHVKVEGHMIKYCLSIG